ncbi:hypothetical protein BDW42DRAFT_190910 [Aspergillus taichungensis]|uniref:BZIP domain-containing protein n=1 Tax=Aspergillus taichungensis TaxID=482145 RepID=A0A2J5I5Z3_9EURO|nr:hypothetical protein BDW42DRAFT_190910 [Aspergillus taichungensis]
MGGRGRKGRIVSSPLAPGQSMSLMSHVSMDSIIESPVPGPLNFSLDSSSSSSLNTISPFDFTSSTTDHFQQQWPPTPPPPQPLAPQNPDYNNNNNNNNNNNVPSEDFVLFPAQSTARDPRPQPPANAAHRLAAYQSYLVRSGHLPRRHSTCLPQQQFSPSPTQVPQVTRLAPQSTGFPLSSSIRSSPSSRKHLLRLHAAAVASNAAPVIHANRPPVPLFHDSTVNSSYQNPQEQPSRRIMSVPNINDMPELFDFSDHFEDFDPTMLSPHQLHTGILPAKDGAPTGTISPKDLLMDASAPPSASFTDLSTPSFDSPGYFSQDTSPMFATDMELGPGHEEWDSLFPAQDGFPLAFDSKAFDPAALDVAAAFAQPNTDVVPPASPAVRSVMSPAPSASPNRVTKPSSTSGVSGRQRKPLLPLKFDTTDPVAAKRARNTEAARKSRARKLERQGVMEKRIAELEKSLEEAQQREQYWKALAQSKA